MSTITSVSELESLPGLAAAKRTLKGIFSHDADVHAVLFYGEEGAGKTRLANLLTQFWLCKEPSEEGPCGTCKACKNFESGSIPDVLPVHPIGASNWIVLRSVYNNPPPYSEEEAKLYPLQDFLRTMPLVGRCKVVCIEQAHRMTNDAAKALLKTLEEPELYAKFILMTTRHGRVHPTIRSRCMNVPCELPSPEGWATAVGEHETWEEDLSRNSPGITLKMRENPEIFQGIHAIAEDVVGSRQEAALAIAERFRKLIDKLKKDEETGARAAAGTALEALGDALAAKNFAPVGRQRIAEAHRRILGNVSAGLELDALFARLLAENER